MGTLRLQPQRLGSGSGLAGAGPGASVEPGVADKTALKAIPPGDRDDRDVCFVESTADWWHFDADSSATSDDTSVIRPDDLNDSQSGRWLRYIVTPAKVSEAVAIDTDIDARVREILYSDNLPSEGIVPGRGSEFKIEPSAPASMSVRVLAVNATNKMAYTQQGVRVERTAAGDASAVIAVADATNPRLDVVSLNAGVLAVTTGAPAVAPVEPTLPSGNIKLAVVLVPAAATQITAGEIYDHRLRAGAEPIDEEHVGNGAAVDFVLASRVSIRLAQQKAVRCYRNGLKTKQVSAGPSGKDEFMLVQGSTGDGTTVRVGAALSTADVLAIEYLR